MKKIILIIHAKQRIIERGIKIKEIKETIDFPDYTILKDNKIEAHKNINSREIKVVYVEDKFIKIITVIVK